MITWIITLRKLMQTYPSLKIGNKIFNKSNILIDLKRKVFNQYVLPIMR